MPGTVGARTYGPLELKPSCGLNPTGYNGPDCFGNPKVCAVPNLPTATDTNPTSFPRGLNKWCSAFVVVPLRTSP